MYLNTTSLDNNLNEFKVVVDTHRPRIIAVTETWFRSSSIVNVSGYKLYKKDRADGRRGGVVGLYIDESIDTNELSDIGFTLDFILTTQSGVVCAIDPRFILGNINKGHYVIFFDFVLKNKVRKASTSCFKFNYR